MTLVDWVSNVMAHAQKPDFVFGRNGGVHLNQRGRQFSRLLAAEVCASAVVMLDSPCSEVVWSVLANHSIRQLPLHFPFRASPYAITFQLDSNNIPWEHDLLFLSTTNWRFGGVTWGDFMKCHLGACYTKRNLARKLLSRDKSARCHKNI